MGSRCAGLSSRLRSAEATARGAFPAYVLTESQPPQANPFSPAILPPPPCQCTAPSSCPALMFPLSAAHLTSMR